MKLFFKRYLIPTIILYIAFILGSYYHSGVIVTDISLYILTFFVFLFIVMLVLSILQYAQNVTGELMKGSWSQRIIFIIVAIVMIFLYKSTGRI